MPLLGDRKGSYPLWPHPWGVGGAKIACHTAFFASLLSSHGAFSSILDSLVQENFAGGKPPYPKIIMVLLGGQYSKHCFSGKSLKTKIYSCGSEYIHRCALRGNVALPAFGTWRPP